MTRPPRDAPSADATERAVPAVIGQLKALRCIVGVAHHGSTIAAASALHMSQSAVTRAILDLEERLQVKLFERGARGMLPTIAGARAARRSQVLLDHLVKGAHESAATMPERERRAGSAERFASAVSPGALKALVAVARSASEAGAGVALSISQPAVHRSLQALEHFCGVTLFKRSSRGTRLTEAGESLLRRTKLAFSEARALESEIAAWRGQMRGRLVIGALPLSVALVLPPAADAVLRRHPEIEIAFVDGTYESLMQQLRSADVDLIVGALRAAPASDDVRQELLFNDELAVVARAGHPCLSQRHLTLEKLLRWDWVVPLDGTPASIALARVFADQGMAAPASSMQASSPAMTRATLMCTDRLGLASRGQALEENRSGTLRLVPVPLPGTVRPIGLTVREGEPSPDLRALIDALHAAARDKQNE